MTLVIGLCAIVLVSARDWRLVLTALMAMYIGLALIAASYLPPEWALLRVVVGGLIAIMWYLSAQRAGWGGRLRPSPAQVCSWAMPACSAAAIAKATSCYRAPSRDR